MEEKEIIKALIDSQILSTLMNELKLTNLFIKAHDQPREALLKKRENLIKLIDIIQENLGE